MPNSLAIVGFNIHTYTKFRAKHTINLVGQKIGLKHLFFLNEFRYAQKSRDRSRIHMKKNSRQSSILIRLTLCNLKSVKKNVGFAVPHHRLCPFSTRLQIFPIPPPSTRPTAEIDGLKSTFSHDTRLGSLSVMHSFSFPLSPSLSRHNNTERFTESELTLQ